MPGLKELQDAFKRNVMLGEAGVSQFVADSATLSRDFRLAIYGNAYRVRLAEALTNDYECLKSLMGEDAFNELCQAYIDSHPSGHFSLRWFGRHMPNHLGHREETGEHDWGAEMAQLEWSFINSFDALDLAIVTQADVASIPPDAWPTLSIKFHPSVRLVSFWWNTLDLWQAVKADDDRPPVPQRLDSPGSCLLWRHGLSTQFRSLEMLEAIALRTALAGADFSELCGVLADELLDQESVPMQAAAFLKGWIESGMISGLRA